MLKRIRDARLGDLAAMVEIYNQAVSEKATADLDPVTVDQRRDWFLEHNSSDRPILVAELDGVVCGWVSLSDYRPGRRALRNTAEISYYVHLQHRRKGVAAQLLRSAIARCSDLGVTSLFAILLENNEPSIHLLRKFGFEKWGLLPKVAVIEGSEVGHLYYGLRLPSPL